MSSFLKFYKGHLKITESAGYITRIEYLNKVEKPKPETETDLEINAKEQLSDYIEGRRKSLNFPVSEVGTKFQKEVWSQLKDIPYGESLSYGEVALSVGGTNYSRAVGGACNKNPLLIYIPCHRVTSQRGLGGFAIDIGVKEKLLAIELSKSSSSRQ